MAKVKVTLPNGKLKLTVDGKLTDGTPVVGVSGAMAILDLWLKDPAFVRNYTIGERGGDPYMLAQLSEDGKEITIAPWDSAYDDDGGPFSKYDGSTDCWSLDDFPFVLEWEIKPKKGRHGRSR